MLQKIPSTQGSIGCIDKEDFIAEIEKNFPYLTTFWANYNEIKEFIQTNSKCVFIDADIERLKLEVIQVFWKNEC